MKYHNVRIHNAFLLIDSYHIQRAYVRQNDRLKREKGMESHIKRQNCPEYVPDYFFGFWWMLLLQDFSKNQISFGFQGFSRLLFKSFHFFPFIIYLYFCRILEMPNVSNRSVYICMYEIDC